MDQTAENLAAENVSAENARAHDYAAQIDQLRMRNHSLASALRKATDQLQGAREKMAALSSPPLTRATFVRIDSDTTVHGQRHVTVEIVNNHRHMVVAVAPDVNPMQLRAGQQVLLDENMRVVRADTVTTIGRVVTVTQVLEGSRLLVRDASGNTVVIRRGYDTANETIQAQDTVMLDESGEFAVRLMESHKAHLRIGLYLQL